MYKHKYFFILTIIFLIHCTPKHKPVNDVLATIGNRTISTDQFTKSYSFGPSALKQGDNPKFAYLNAMINELILYEMLSQNPQHISQDDSRLMLVKEEYLVEKIFIENVNEKIFITDAEIIEAIKVSKRKLKLKYLFTRFIDTAEKCLKVLSEGKNLDELKDELYDISDEFFTGETGYLVYGEIDEPINSIVFSIIPGEKLKIISTQLGYYILKVDDIITNSISDMDIETSRDRHKKILWNKKGNKLTREFLNTFMSPKKIIVRASSFSTMVNELFRVYMKYNFLPDNYYKSPDQFETINSDAYWLQDTLVTYDSGSILTWEIISHMQRRSLFFDTKTIDVFAKDLEKKLAIIIRDLFLIKEAKIKGYQNDMTLAREVNLWKINLVVNDYISTISKDLFLESYYDTSDKFKRKTNRNIFTETRDLITHKLDSMKSSIHIEIDDDLLSNIQVDNKMIGHIPDVKLFKLGLPYFRLAYPSLNPILGIIK